MNEIIPFSWKSETQTHFFRKKKQKNRPLEFSSERSWETLFVVYDLQAQTYIENVGSRENVTWILMNGSWNISRNRTKFDVPGRSSPKDEREPEGLISYPIFQNTERKKKKQNIKFRMFFSFLNRLFSLKWVVSKKKDWDGSGRVDSEICGNF